jgi:RND family efflux transporter MFP subunit
MVCLCDLVGFQKYWPSAVSGPARIRHRSMTALLAVVITLSFACEKKKEAAAPPAPPDVEVVEVAQENVPITKEWIGTMDGLVNAQIRAQVGGYLLKQNYQNGDFVAKGALLFQLDPRPFQATLDQSQANVEQARGKLAQAQGDLARSQAQLGKASIDVKRYIPLAKQSAISQQELDDAIQNELASKAQVEANQASIEAAKSAITAALAAVETARLNLGFTSITSPVSGVSAIATAQVGDLVGPQSGTLTTVSSLDPILVNITPSEQEYLTTARQIGAVTGAATDVALQKLVFRLELANGAKYSHQGRIYAVNRDVTVTTGTILVQISFPNPGSLLRPGGFGRVSTVARIQEGALVVPQRSVAEMQGAYLVAVVAGDNKVALRPVKPGARYGSMWVIDEGLRRGERVVAEGIQKVRPGMQVNPKPYSPPSGNAKPAAQ